MQREERLTTTRPRRLRRATGRTTAAGGQGSKTIQPQMHADARGWARSSSRWFTEDADGPRDGPRGLGVQGSIRVHQRASAVELSCFPASSTPPQSNRRLPSGKTPCTRTSRCQTARPRQPPGTGTTRCGTLLRRRHPMPSGQPPGLSRHPPTRCTPAATKPRAPVRLPTSPPHRRSPSTSAAAPGEAEAHAPVRPPTSPLHRRSPSTSAAAPGKAEAHAPVRPPTGDRGANSIWRHGPMPSGAATGRARLSGGGLPRRFAPRNDSGRAPRRSPAIHQTAWPWITRQPGAEPHRR